LEWEQRQTMFLAFDHCAWMEGDVSIAFLQQVAAYSGCTWFNMGSKYYKTRFIALSLRSSKQLPGYSMIVFDDDISAGALLTQLGIGRLDARGLVTLVAVPNLHMCVKKERIRFETGAQIFLSHVASVSSCHFDAMDSILFVLLGSKVVHMAPPHASHGVVSPGVAAFETEAQQPHTGTVLHSALWRQCTLHAGEALFIPAGWWHQVISMQGTCAVSVTVSAS
jgi:hypothetical protein